MFFSKPLTEQYSVNPQNGSKKTVTSLRKWITTPLIKELDNIDPHRSRYRKCGSFACQLHSLVGQAISLFKYLVQLRECPIYSSQGENLNRYSGREPVSKCSPSRFHSCERNNEQISASSPSYPPDRPWYILLL